MNMIFIIIESKNFMDDLGYKRFSYASSQSCRIQNGEETWQYLICFVPYLFKLAWPGLWHHGDSNALVWNML